MHFVSKSDAIALSGAYPAIMRSPLLSFSELRTLLLEVILVLGDRNKMNF
jgi:hypothetical protein